MNLTDSFYNSLVFGNIFKEVNKLVAQATSTVQIIVGLLGVIAFLLISAKGSWRINAIIIGILVGGLLVWGAVSGVPWMANQAKSTITTTGIFLPTLAY